MHEDLSDSHSNQNVAFTDKNNELPVLQTPVSETQFEYPLISIVSPSKILEDEDLDSSGELIFEPQHTSSKTMSPEMIVVDSTSGSEEEPCLESKAKSPRSSEKNRNLITFCNSSSQRSIKMLDFSPQSLNSNKGKDSHATLIECSDENVTNKATPSHDELNSSYVAPILSKSTSFVNAASRELELNIPGNTAAEKPASPKPSSSKDTFEDEDVEELELRKIALEGLIANYQESTQDTLSMDDNTEADDEILRAKLLIDMVNKRTAVEAQAKKLLPEIESNSNIDLPDLRTKLSQKMISTKSSSSALNSFNHMQTRLPNTAVEIPGENRQIVFADGGNIVLTSFTKSPLSISEPISNSSTSDLSLNLSDQFISPRLSHHSKNSKAFPSRCPKEKIEFSNSAFGIKKTIYNKSGIHVRTKKSRQKPIVIPVGLDSSDEDDDENQKQRKKSPKATENFASSEKLTLKSTEKTESNKSSDNTKKADEQILGKNISEISTGLSDEINTAAMVDQKFEKSVSDYLKAMRTKVAKEQASTSNEMPSVVEVDSPPHSPVSPAQASTSSSLPITGQRKSHDNDLKQKVIRLYNTNEK